MDPIASIGAAQQALKAALGLVRGAVGAAVDHQVKDKLIDIQQAILDVQAQLGDAQEERLTLLHQNADLKDRVRSLETERAALDAYELHAFHPGQYAYRPKASSLQAATRHYACANCYSAGRISILSARWDQEFQQTHVMCPACKTDSWVDGHGPVD